jgi:serine/threonine-protein kinase
MPVWKSLARILGFGETPSSQAATADGQGPNELERGQIVGEYVVERKLGEGGFGAVYRAIHPVIGKAAAVKVLHPQYSSNPEMISRFVSEARAVNQIRHRHIIDIFSFGSLEDGRHYYVMELLEGVTLDSYLEHAGRLEPREALPILRAVARALQAAHDAGIAHRDLKPENVFLALDDDGTVFPKILDFGVAKLLTEAGPGPMHKTHTGTPIGTPRYMSPEQCQGRKVDHRTDIYAFGIIAFRMLAGRLPFDARAALELMLMHVGTEPPKLSETVDGLDSALDGPVLRMLEKDPDRRPSTLTEAFDALQRAAESAGVPQGSFRISLTPEIQKTIQQARIANRRADRGTPSGVQTPARPAYPVSGQTHRQAHRISGRVLAVAIVMTMAAGLAIVWTLSLRSNSRTVSASVAETYVEPTASPHASSASTASASYAPSTPSSVSWTFETSPPEANVFLGERRLGRAPGPFFVPRRNAKATVTLKAPGHEDESIQLEATDDQVVSVQLRRRLGQPTPVQPNVPKDLEYPF